MQTATPFDFSYMIILQIESWLGKGNPDKSGSGGGYIRDCQGNILETLDQVTLAIEDGRLAGALPEALKLHVDSDYKI